MGPSYQRITPEHFDGVLFDLDGVLTSTAKIHARCWKAMFDDFLSRRATQRREPLEPTYVLTAWSRIPSRRERKGLL